jgi:hypothetical protein
MEHNPYKKKISCPVCGNVGTIHVLKVIGNEILIKQKCPIHGTQVYTIPYGQRHQFLPYIKDAVFRCYVCGQKANATFSHVKGPWTLLKSYCTNHEHLQKPLSYNFKLKMNVQKIWTSIYKEFLTETKVKTTPQVPQPQVEKPIKTETKKFCHNCGAQLEEEGNFCGECGEKAE